ncbi:LuxR C-terminal-related transcriptional regulator [Sphingobium cloacae]|uniref:Two component transcriptional regulator, LuxR family n=1 Tax=Sphingobium cloacae TaxID=120107 RepID=A0A1E1F544_9SPHN|nr:response regulator transcription factor [Sphingobium cloacae]BAV65645.1 two component transcriptional regulator, LuxR family [Sphingobium cloacae]
MTTASKVVLIGRSSIVREGLRCLLSEQDRQIIFSGFGLEDLQRADVAESDFLLLLIEDKRSEWDGDALAAIHRRHPAARIAILANEFDFSAMLEAFRVGVEGYLTKDVPWERLIGYLDLITLGEKIFPSQLAQKLIDRSSAYDHVPNAATIDSANISARELEILRRLIAGLPNKVISRQLSISEATVKVHVKAVLRKLRVTNRTQAAIWAATQGLQGMGMDGEWAAPAVATSRIGSQPSVAAPAYQAGARAEPHLAHA